MMSSNQFSLLILMMLATLLNACASMPGGVDSPVVRVVGIEPLPSEGLEARFLSGHPVFRSRWIWFFLNRE